MVERDKYLLTCEPQIKTLLDCVYRGYKISSLCYTMFFQKPTISLTFKRKKHHSLITFMIIIIGDNHCLGLISPYTSAYEWSTYSQVFEINVQSQCHLKCWHSLKNMIIFSLVSHINRFYFV